MIWFLLPLVSIFGFAAAIDYRRKKNRNTFEQTTHAESHLSSNSSYESNGDFSGGND